MKGKIIIIFVFMLLIATSMDIMVTAPAYKIRLGSTGGPCVFINKTVKCIDEEEWFKEIDVFAGTTVRFWITVYNCGDSDLKEVEVLDELPSGLDYISGSATPLEPEVQGNTLIWSFGTPLQPHEALYVRFNAVVISEGKHVNEVNVSVKSDGTHFYDENNATVYSTLPPSVNIDKWVWDPNADNGEGDWIDEKSIEFGGEVRFKIRIYNDGQNTLYNIVVNDTLLEGFEFAGNANPVPEIYGDRLTWEYSSLVKWHIKEMEFNVTAVKEGEHINTAKVTAERYGFTVNDSNNATVYVGENPDESDLVCEGTLSWTNITPGTEITGSFVISNIGDSASELDWKVESAPDLDNDGDTDEWTFSPNSGDNLKPGDGLVTVQVSVVAPDEEEQIFSGEIKVINKEDSSDYCTISVSLVTPKNKVSNLPILLLQFLENHPQMFQLLRQLLELQE